MPENSLPLCVDLDGTLLLTDLTLESLLLLAKRRPLEACRILALSFFKGKAYLKEQLAARASLSIADLPYHEPLLNFLKAEHLRGRPLYLATGSNKRLAQEIAESLGLFTGAFASNASVNLTGHRKAKRLSEAFGARGFAYAGNSWADRHVWRVAGEAILVNPAPFLASYVKRRTELGAIFDAPFRRARALWRGIRPRHSAKNLLLFVPWMTAHKFYDGGATEAILGGFVSFCCCTSGIYLFNDLLDLGSDRLHPHKRNRPLAAGALPLGWGLVSGLTLIGLGIIASFWVAPSYPLALFCYVALACAYSLFLKKFLMIDVLALSMLYTLRIFSGAIAVDVPVSPWLLAFSMFLFLSLALLKRYVELSSVPEMTATNFRPYALADIPMIAGFGMVSAYLAVLVFALYADSAAVASLYLHPRRLWLIGLLLLYWNSRAWILARRGEVKSDPIDFLVGDRETYGLVALAALSLWLAGPR